VVASYFISKNAPKLGIIAEKNAIIGICFGQLPPAAAVWLNLASSPAENDTVEQAKVELAEYFAGTRKTFSLQLSPQGTDFQRNVWKELVKIPWGETRSYRSIAQAVGSPNAARATGGAIHHNPIVIMIPCHRIIGANGSLTGFGGGLPLKKQLLELEKVKLT
jgi:methylated-DNA-[protein]-cysteine S-methyltransferase